MTQSFGDYAHHRKHSACLPACLASSVMNICGGGGAGATKSTCLQQAGESQQPAQPNMRMPRHATASPLLIKFSRMRLSFEELTGAASPCCAGTFLKHHLSAEQKNDFARTMKTTGLRSFLFHE